jgi:hypothetical protein
MKLRQKQSSHANANKHVNASSKPWSVYLGGKLKLILSQPRKFNFLNHHRTGGKFVLAIVPTATMYMMINRSYC